VLLTSSLPNVHLTTCIIGPPQQETASLQNHRRSLIQETKRVDGGSSPKCLETSRAGEE
jgi:hypothetical protein